MPERRRTALAVYALAAACLHPRRRPATRYRRPCWRPLGLAHQQGSGDEAAGESSCEHRHRLQLGQRKSHAVSPDPDAHGIVELGPALLPQRGTRGAQARDSPRAGPWGARRPAGLATATAILSAHSSLARTPDAGRALAHRPAETLHEQRDGVPARGGIGRQSALEGAAAARRSWTRRAAPGAEALRAKLGPLSLGRRRESGPKAERREAFIAETDHTLPKRGHDGRLLGRLEVSTDMFLSKPLAAGNLWTAGAAEGGAASSTQEAPREANGLAPM